MLETYSNLLKTREVLQLSMKQKLFRFGFFVDDVRVGVCFVFSLFFYDVIAEPSGQFRGSKFVWILGYNTSLWRA